MLAHSAMDTVVTGLGSVLVRSTTAFLIASKTAAPPGHRLPCTTERAQTPPLTFS